MSSQYSRVTTTVIITAYESEFIKSYLYNIYQNNYEEKEFTIRRLLALNGIGHGIPTPVVVTDDTQMRMTRIVDEVVTLTISYKAHDYELMLFIDYNQDRRRIHMMYLLGLDDDAKECSTLQKYIQYQAVRCSSMNGKTIQITDREMSGWLQDTEEVDSEIIEVGNTTLDDIFLPVQLKDYLNLFIHSVRNFASLQKPLRFLFSGKPGTAKTKIIQAIANECKKAATFIFTNGSEKRIYGMFSLAQHFSPVVLCIDDLDFMTGNRDDRTQSRSLGLLLQKLDGFVQRDLFILATTNDKKLVDLAASRPGRFDMIIDVNVIEPAQYQSLVTSKTKDKEIIDLFDDEILALLRGKKATGAFIANVVKHMELMKEYNPLKISQEYLMELVHNTQKGFYKEPIDANTHVGFEN